MDEQHVLQFLQNSFFNSSFGIAKEKTNIYKLLKRIFD